MLNDSRAAFPNRIRALVVDSDARFLRSACLMLSLLNFRVATCESPASAIKLLTGRLKDADVVFIDALRAAICGFDFRGIVERDLFTPVIYFFSFDYKVAGDVAEALRHTVWSATYVIKKPLDAAQLCSLWRIIQWSKDLLRRGEKTLPWLEWPSSNQALPAAGEAPLPSSSGQGEKEDDGGDLFKVARAGRGRRRKLGDSRDGGSSVHGRDGVGGSLQIGGQPTRRLAEKMNVTEGQESDDDELVPSHQLQQPTQHNRRGLQADVQNQQHGRSLLMQYVPQMLKLPRNNPMISTDAAGPSSSNVAAVARDSNNTSVPALLPLPMYQAPALVYSAEAQAAGQPPPVYQQQQQPVATAARGRRRKLGDSIDGGSSSRGRGGVGGSFQIGGQPTGRQEQMNVTEAQESNGDDVVPGHQQPARQNRRGLQATDVQNQQHGRSLLMQYVPQVLSVPHNPMMTGDAAGPSSGNATDFAGAGYISAPALLPEHQPPARARATSPAPHVLYSTHAPAPGLPPVQQQQPVALYDFGKMVATPAAAVPTMAATSGHQAPPQFTLNNLHYHQDMFAPRSQDGWMGRRRETAPAIVSFQQPPAADPFTPMAGGTDAGAYWNLGAQPEPADKFDDVLRAMMELNETFKRSYANRSADVALMSPATEESAAMQAALDSGNCSNYNAGSFMVTDVNGGSNSASSMAPQDPAEPTTGNQVELGAPDIIYGSLVESPGTSAMFNDMAAMFPSNQYNENAMISLDALWNFGDDIPMHPEGQQVAAADSTAAANATGIMSDGGESGGLGPNWNMGAAADEGLDMLEEYLVDHNASDFLVPQDKNNGHQ